MNYGHNPKTLADIEHRAAPSPSFRWGTVAFKGGALLPLGWTRTQSAAVLFCELVHDQYPSTGVVRMEFIAGRRIG